MCKTCSLVCVCFSPLSLSFADENTAHLRSSTNDSFPVSCWVTDWECLKSERNRDIGFCSEKIVPIQINRLAQHFLGYVVTVYSTSWLWVSSLRALAVLRHRKTSLNGARWRQGRSLAQERGFLFWWVRRADGPSQRVTSDASSPLPAPAAACLHVSVSTGWGARVQHTVNSLTPALGKNILISLCHPPQPCFELCNLYSLSVSH